MQRMLGLPVPNVDRTRKLRDLLRMGRVVVVESQEDVGEETQEEVYLVLVMKWWQPALSHSVQLCQALLWPSEQCHARISLWDHL